MHRQRESILLAEWICIPSQTTEDNLAMCPWVWGTQLFSFSWITAPQSIKTMKFFIFFKCLLKVTFLPSFQTIQFIVATYNCNHLFPTLLFHIFPKYTCISFPNTSDLFLNGHYMTRYHIICTRAYTWVCLVHWCIV